MMFSTVTASLSGLQAVVGLDQAPPRGACERRRPDAGRKSPDARSDAHPGAPPNSCSAQCSRPAPTSSGASGARGSRARQSACIQPSASSLPHGPVARARRFRHASRPPESSFPHAGLSKVSQTGDSRSAPRNRSQLCGPRWPAHARQGCGTRRRAESESGTSRPPGANGRAFPRRPSQRSRHSSLCADAANPTAPSQPCADPTAQLTTDQRTGAALLLQHRVPYPAMPVTVTNSRPSTDILRHALRRRNRLREAPRMPHATPRRRRQRSPPLQTPPTPSGSPLAADGQARPETLRTPAASLRRAKTSFASNPCKRAKSSRRLCRT